MSNRRFIILKPSQHLIIVAMFNFSSTNVRQFAEHYQKAPETVYPEELRQYFILLKCAKKVARKTATQAICAIKLLGGALPSRKDSRSQ